MPNYLPTRAPGVYVTDINSIPNSVAQVETAIPAFVGYTGKTELNGKSLLNTPYRITSLRDFVAVFGGPATEQFDWTKGNDPVAFECVTAKASYYIKRTSPPFELYQNIVLYFLNGGGPCYVVSSGDYQQTPLQAALNEGISALTQVLDATLLVVPDAMSLMPPACYAVQQNMLQHCADMKNRVSILDVHEAQCGVAQSDASFIQSVQDFRNNIDNQFVGHYGAAYAPYLKTQVFDTTQISFKNFSQNALKMLFNLLIADIAPSQISLLSAVASLQLSLTSGGAKSLLPARSASSEKKLHQALITECAIYDALVNTIVNAVNICGPCGAIAGAIVKSDTSVGVWKAPANISLMGTISPTISISNKQQEILTREPSGKSINAIRFFSGRGTLIWGARTYNANNVEWRYINIKRTEIMVRESVGLALKDYLHSPNDHDTWQAIKASIEQFLYGLWQQGALCGARPKDAFAVKIGINETMTTSDIINHNLKLSIMLAITKPAEFIVINITQKMQTS